jgi:branched-chain amino acid transport system permease protein
MVEESTSLLVSGIINGLCLAGIYILIALGLTLILSIMNILQFAHGEVYMIGAYIVYFFMVRFGMNAILAILVSMVLTGILGLILERFIFRHFLNRFIFVICVATGLMLILQTSAVLLFGLDTKKIPNFVPGTISVLGANVPNDRLAAVVAGIVLTSLLYLFLKRSKFGQAIVATAQNREGAILQGINPYLMYSLVMGIGSALAAVAGSFTGSIFMLDPYMGGVALMKGVAIIVIGGMGSIMGIIIGGVLLGLSDGIIAIYFGSGAATIVPLLLVIFILVIKPEGLFGDNA